MSQNLQLQKGTNPQLARIRHRRRLTTSNPRLASRMPALSNFLDREAIRANASPLRIRENGNFGVAAAGTGYKAGDLFLIDGGTFTIQGSGIVETAAEFATGTLTMSLNAAEGETVTLGSVVYNFTATLAAANDVLIGAASADSIANLVAAINGGAGEGTVYGTGTIANPGATAADASPDMVATAKARFEAGELESTETGANMAWSSAALEWGQVSSTTHLDRGEYTVAPGLGATTTPTRVKNGRTPGTGLTVDVNNLTQAVTGVTDEELLDGLKGQYNVAIDQEIITRARNFRDPRNASDTYLDNGVPIV